MLIERVKMFNLLEEMTRDQKISVDAKLIIMQELRDKYDELQPPKELISLLQQASSK